MGMFSVLDVSAAGMDVQQARLEVAAANLANAQTSRGSDGKAYEPLTVVVRSTQVEGNGATGGARSGAAFAQSVGANLLPRPAVSEVVPLDLAPRLVHDPGHPDADERGFVTYPGVDPVALMLDLMNISRGYEANLRAFDLTRSLLQRTLEIGSRR